MRLGFAKKVQNMVLSATNNVSVFQRLHNGVSFIDHDKPSTIHRKLIHSQLVMGKGRNQMVAIGTEGG